MNQGRVFCWAKEWGKNLGLISKKSAVARSWPTYRALPFSSSDSLFTKWLKKARRLVPSEVRIVVTFPSPSAYRSTLVSCLTLDLLSLRSMLMKLLPRCWGVLAWVGKWWSRENPKPRLSMTPCGRVSKRTRGHTSPLICW